MGTWAYGRIGIWGHTGIRAYGHMGFFMQESQERVLSIGSLKENIAFRSPNGRHMGTRAYAHDCREAYTHIGIWAYEPMGTWDSLCRSSDRDFLRWES